MTPAPAFSVIVPVYRHWDLVPGLLAALAAQSFRDFEILLVDNAPEEPRPPLALPQAARILPCAEPGSYAARNVGTAAAKASSQPGSGRQSASVKARIRPRAAAVPRLRAA